MSSHKKGRKNHGQKQVPPLPPPLQLAPVIPVVLRYLKTNATSAVVSSTDFGKLVVFATSSTVGYAPYEAIRVKKIVAWSPCATMTSATGFSIPSVVLTQQSGWLAGIGSEKVSQGFSSGSTCGRAKLKLPPPSNDWVEPVGTAGVNMIKVSGPIGCVVDVHCVLRLYVKSSPLVPLASTGATVGKMYGNVLDTATGYLQNQNFENNGNTWV